MTQKCPGQDPRYRPTDYIREETCPSCGRPVEFFKDDRSQKCPSCGTRFRNPRGADTGCIAWCPYAAQCADFVPPDPPDEGSRPPAP